MAAAVMSGLTHTDVHHRVTRILNHAADRLRIRIQQRRVICSLHKLVRWRQRIRAVQYRQPRGRPPALKFFGNFHTPPI